MTDPATYTTHTILNENGTPRCGAPDPGPIRWGQVNRVVACTDCLHVEPGGLRREETVAGHLDKVRADLKIHLRSMSEADRAAWKESVFSTAAASLVDPDCAPSLFDEPQLLAALYALSATRAGAWHAKRAGVPASYAVFETALHSMEMILVALCEGTPL